MIRRFNRFELKYVIRSDLRERVVEDLAAQMKPDAMGDARGWYRVTSLYYDSPDRACYRAKIEGIKYRRKVRIRTYSPSVEDDSEKVMLEIKQRINRTVQKRRLSMPLADAYAAAVGTPVKVDGAEDQKVIDEVLFIAHSLHLEPACVISYQRQAWVGSDAELGLRVTFDQDLTCRPPDERLGPDVGAHLFMPPDMVVMEVKVNERIPLWVTRLLAKHQCPMRRMSKYCAGIAHLDQLGRKD